MDNVILYSKLAHLPDNIKSEVADFIDFLMNKNKKPLKGKPRFGSAKGMFRMNKNFDLPIDDFKDYQ